MAELIYTAKDFDSAYVVNNWPWGWTLKTEARFWIETTKVGDRFVQQTKNPKTGKWCKPKKSTYDAVLVLAISDKGKVCRVGFAKGANDTAIAKSLETLDWDKLSDMQKKQVCKWTAWNDVITNVTWECKPYDPDTKENQDKIMANIAKAASYKTIECLKKNNLV
jgi:hypothetical protein